MSRLIRKCLVGAAVLMAADSALAQPRKDAAEAVQEGSVANWLEYYRRERAPGGEAKTAPKPVVPAEMPSGAPSGNTPPR